MRNPGRVGSLQRPWQWLATSLSLESPRTEDRAARCPTEATSENSLQQPGRWPAQPPVLVSPREGKVRCLPPEGSHLRDTTRGLSALHRPLRALSRSPTPEESRTRLPRRTRNVAYSFPPAPAEKSRARTAPSDTHAARPPFHPQSTVAVAAGAHDGSQQLHATLTPTGNSTRHLRPPRAAVPHYGNRAPGGPYCKIKTKTAG